MVKLACKAIHMNIYSVHVLEFHFSKSFALLIIPTSFTLCSSSAFQQCFCIYNVFLNSLKKKPTSVNCLTLLLSLILPCCFFFLSHSSSLFTSFKSARQRWADGLVKNTKHLGPCDLSLGELERYTKPLLHAPILSARWERVAQLNRRAFPLSSYCQRNISR